MLFVSSELAWGCTRVDDFSFSMTDLFFEDFSQYLYPLGQSSTLTKTMGP